MSKRCTAYDLKYGFDDETILKLKRSDPTGDRCVYLDWIYKQYNKKEFLLEDVLRVKEDLILYDTNKVRMDKEDKDINRFTYSTLKILLRDKFTKLEEYTILEGSDVVEVSKGPYGGLYSPLTKEASCRLGSGTKWCTAAKNANMFDEYHKDGYLYIWIDSYWNKGVMLELNHSKSKKFQFQFESSSYMDELDNKIEDDLLLYFSTKHPVLSQQFDRYIESIKDDPEKVVKYIKGMPNKDDLIRRLVLGKQNMEYVFVNEYRDSINSSKLIPDIIKRYQDYMEEYNNPEDIARYILTYTSKKEYLDKYIIGRTDREAAFAYVSGKTWEEKFKMGDIDRKIVSDSSHTLKYVRTLIRGKRYKKKELTNTDNIVVRAVALWEKNISIEELYEASPPAAVYYAIHVIKCRCKYIEIQGMSDNKDLNRMYDRLFVYGYDIPTNMYQLTPKFVDLLYGNESYFFNSNNDLKDYRFGSKYTHDQDMYLTYKAYINKYGRSEIIERFLVEYNTFDEPYDSYLNKIVFDGRISYALGYIRPDVEELLVGPDYKYIVNEQLSKITDLDDITKYIKMHGTNDAVLIKLLDIMDRNIMENKIEVISLLSIDDLNFIYRKIRHGDVLQFMIYPLLFDIRSPELESYYKKLLTMSKSYNAIDHYQHYWLKFFKGAYDESLHNSGRTYIYWENYKGKIEKLESGYSIPVEYLTTRVKQ